MGRKEMEGHVNGPLNVCVTPKSICRTPVSKLMIFASGAFGRLGHEGGAPMNGISAFIKEAAESALVLCSM